MIKKIISYTLIVLIIAACATANKTSSKTQNNNYKRDGSTIHPQFTIFHVNDSISELHFKINARELLYMRNDGINFASNVLISYQLLAAYDAKEIIDSASVRLVDIDNSDADKILVGKIDVKAKSPRSYYLRAVITDLNRNIDVTNLIALEKNNDLNRQNFMVKSKATDAPLFTNYFKPGEELTITYKAKMAVNIYVRYYKRDLPLAAPPFATSYPKAFQFRPDSAFTLQLSANGSVDFTSMKKGFYHLQLDTSKLDGLTLFNFSENFPYIKRAEDMIPPLRYITSREEYDELTTTTAKRISVEKFWMNCTGNVDRGKETIRKFYNRVQDANLYFSSYMEGWKTDRGMIYLIYGSPNLIYRTENSETWIYGEENNINSLQYAFSKVNNPFTDNDYELDRSAVYKQSWYTAVDIWRQGRTYLQD